MHFNVSGVSVPALVPPAVAVDVSFLTSTVGVSGSILLVPLRMSLLGIVAPSISATNLVVSLAATPGGLFRFAREHRLDWRLGGMIGPGTLPGLPAGWWLRSHWLLDRRVFSI